MDCCIEMLAHIELAGKLFYVLYLVALLFAYSALLTLSASQGKGLGI